MKTNKIIIISLIIGLIAGVLIGMAIQQIIIIKGIEKAGEGLEGVISNMNIKIDLNESKLVEATWKILPILNLEQIK